jgi:hypothetical protein
VNNTKLKGIKVMLNDVRNRLGKSFVGAMMSMALAGISSLTPAALKPSKSGGMGPGLPHPPKPPRVKRKGYRTTKAEGVYGRNLRAHFDRKRLTRAQLKKFYAGKAI